MDESWDRRHLDEGEGAGLDLEAYLMPIRVHELAATADYVRILEGHPPRFPPGTSFAYCNAGYVILALVLERVTGTPFPDLMREGVCQPQACTTQPSSAPTSSRVGPPSAT